MTFRSVVPRTLVPQSFAPQISSVRPTRAWSRTTIGIDDAVKDIETSISNALTSGREPYQKVVALLFHWDNDDMGVEPLENELAEIFRQFYDFDVEQEVIPADPERSTAAYFMQGRLLAFSNKYKGPGNLLIYVYSGHADPGHTGSGCFLYGAGSPKFAPQIDWTIVKSATTTGLPDANLYVLDCAFAASVTVQYSSSGPEGGEYLAASATVGSSRAGQPNSLTSRLIGILKRFRGAPMTVACLHNYLMAEMDDPAHQLDAVPVYVPPSATPSAVLTSKSRRQTRASPIQELQGLNLATARVLVTIDLDCQSSPDNVAAFRRSLQSSIPGDIAASIKVEAAFENQSQLSLLVSLPVFIWATLKEHSSINFVAHVKASINIGEEPGR